MSQDLDELMNRLQATAPDHALDGLSFDVGQRIAERAAAHTQVWGLRAAAVALVTVTGVAISASSTVAAAVETTSPFAAWSQLAPSTLLDRAE